MLTPAAPLGGAPGPASQREGPGRRRRGRGAERVASVRPAPAAGGSGVSLQLPAEGAVWRCDPGAAPTSAHRARAGSPSNPELPPTRLSLRAGRGKFLSQPPVPVPPPDYQSRAAPGRAGPAVPLGGRPPRPAARETGLVSRNACGGWTFSPRQSPFIQPCGHPSPGGRAVPLWRGPHSDQRCPVPPSAWVYSKAWLLLFSAGTGVSSFERAPVTSPSHFLCAQAFQLYGTSPHTPYEQHTSVSSQLLVFHSEFYSSATTELLRTHAALFDPPSQVFPLPTIHSGNSPPSTTLQTPTLPSKPWSTSPSLEPSPHHSRQS